MDYWTSAELAKAAGVSRRWINQLCSGCALRRDDPSCPFPKVVMRAGAWFIPRDEGEEWLEIRKGMYFKKE